MVATYSLRLKVTAEGQWHLLSMGGASNVKSAEIIGMLSVVAVSIQS